MVVHDKKTYGQGLALQFKAQFEKNGGKVPTVETIEPEDKDFAAVLSKIKRSNPDMIYYGGEYPAASLLTSQADQQGLKVPLMGGDGIYSGTYISVAKAAGEGDLATSVGAPTDKLATAKSFVDAYAAAGYADPYEAYGAYSYDAANVIIDGPGQGPRRRRRDRRRGPGQAVAGRPGRQRRRRHRQGGLRRVRRHHHQGPHRLQGREGRRRRSRLEAPGDGANSSRAGRPST